MLIVRKLMEMGFFGEWNNERRENKRKESERKREKWKWEGGNWKTELSFESELNTKGLDSIHLSFSWKVSGISGTAFTYIHIYTILFFLMGFQAPNQIHATQCNRKCFIIIDSRKIASILNKYTQTAWHHAIGMRLCCMPFVHIFHFSM